MNRTKIEYLTHTWSPIAMRCTPVSPACENCWHLQRATMLANNPKIPFDLCACYRGDAPPKLVNYRLNDPLLKSAKPKMIGVQFMGDIAHEKVTIEQFAAVFDKAKKHTQHTFLFLTKRPQHMAYFFSEYAIFNYGILPNVWIGVTAENQEQADKRIPILLQVPAAVRFVSVEPMLGPIKMKFTGCPKCGKSEQKWWPNYTICKACGEEVKSPPKNIDWLICGAETANGARYMQPEWAYDLYEQCRAAEVPFFFKTASKGDIIDLPREYPK